MSSSNKSKVVNKQFSLENAKTVEFAQEQSIQDDCSQHDNNSSKQITSSKSKTLKAQQKQAKKDEIVDDLWNLLANLNQQTNRIPVAKPVRKSVRESFNESENKQVKTKQLKLRKENSQVNYQEYTQVDLLNQFLELNVELNAKSLDKNLSEDIESKDLEAKDFECFEQQNQDSKLSTVSNMTTKQTFNDIQVSTDDLESRFEGVKKLTQHINSVDLPSTEDLEQTFKNLQATASRHDELIDSISLPQDLERIYSPESIEQASPVMKQWFEAKLANKDKIIFFRMGDFYEFFYDDAITTARELNLSVSSRQKHLGQPIPMAGIPFHAYEAYASKIVSKGYSIAICEQVSDPKAKGLTQRAVVRIFTPGTLSEDSYLPERESRCLVAIASNHLS